MIRWFYIVEDKIEIMLKKNIGDIGEIYVLYKFICGWKIVF